MAEISPEVEAALAAMTDAEYAAFTQKVRAPDTTEAFRAAAAEILGDGDALDAFMAFADPSKFLDTNGNIDKAQIAGRLTAAFGMPAPAAAQYGQHSGGDPNRFGGPAAGLRGRAAAARRFGTKLSDEDQAALGQTTGPGANARAALAKRFPNSTKDA